MRGDHRQALREILTQVEQWGAALEAGGAFADRALAFVGEAMSYALEADPEGQDPDLMRLFDASAEYAETLRSVLRG